MKIVLWQIIRNKIKARIYSIKMKYAIRWVTAAGLHVVQMEEVAGSLYLVAPNGQRYKVGK